MSYIEQAKQKAISGLVGVLITGGVWVTQATLSNTHAAEQHAVQLTQQSAQLAKTAERIERLDRLAERSVAVHEGVQRVLDRLESRVDNEVERRKR